MGIFRLELGDPGLATEALADLPRGGGFEKEVDGFAQVGEGGFRGGALAGDIQIRIEGDVFLALFADDGGEAGFHLFVFYDLKAEKQQGRRMRMMIRMRTG